MMKILPCTRAHPQAPTYAHTQTHKHSLPRLIEASRQWLALIVGSLYKRVGSRRRALHNLKLATVWAPRAHQPQRGHGARRFLCRFASMCSPQPKTCIPKPCIPRPACPPRAHQPGRDGDAGAPVPGHATTAWPVAPGGDVTPRPGAAWHRNPGLGPRKRPVTRGLSRVT